MPSKNIIKTYSENSYYHVYNRGVEKRTIFTSAKDYNVFLNYLAEYLIPPTVDEATPGLIYYNRKSYSDSISIQAFVLMPNHFHLLLHQTDLKAMSQFLQSLCTRYSMYFNRQQNRVGSLFQGRYKAVLVNSNEQLLHVSRYVHCNPLTLGYVPNLLSEYQYSSYPVYINHKPISWIKHESIRDILTEGQDIGTAEKAQQYKAFVELFAEQNVIDQEAELI